MKILFDTNIILDIYLANRKNNKKAIELFNTLLKYDCTALVSISSLNTCFFTISRQLSSIFENNKRYLANEVAWQIVNLIVENFAIVGLDTKDEFIARKFRNYHEDYEDNLITAASIRSNADLIVSEDKKFIENCPKSILNTEKAIKYIKTEFCED